MTDYGRAEYTRREDAEAELLEDARATYPHIEIMKAAEGGCCDGCGAEEASIYLTPVNWLCGACLKEYAEQEPTDG